MVAAGLVLWVGFRLYTDITLEDALITFRYAENLALGQGFCFNPGEPVLGTSTPLLALILAGVGWAAGVSFIPVAANLLLFCASGAAGLLVYAALRRLAGASVALAGIALFILNRDMVWVTAGGMETPLVLFLMALGFWALAARRPRWAALAAGLLVLARPDGLVWAGLVCLVVGWQERRRALVPALIFLSVVLPWIIWAHFYFGSALPHSITAKRAMAMTYPLVEFLQWYARVVSGGIPYFRGLAGVAFLLPAGLVLGGVVMAWRRRRETPGWIGLLPTMYLAAFALFLFVGHAPHTFRWYLAPPILAALLTAAWASGAVADGRIGFPWRVAAAVGTSALLGGQILLLGKSFEFSQRFQANENAQRRRAGEWLNAQAHPSASVAMEAIGYQGTFARRRVIDLAGLISPDVVEIHRRSGSNAEVIRRVLSELRPDYLILRAFEVDENRCSYGGKLFSTDAERAEFHGAYQERVRFAAPYPEAWEEGVEIVIFERRGSKGMGE